MTSIRKTYCQLLIDACEFLYYYTQETSCLTRTEAVKEWHGYSRNELVKLSHVKLGRSKSQQEEAGGTEGKWVLLCLAALSFTFDFFFAFHFLLFCHLCSCSQPETWAHICTKTSPCWPLQRASSMNDTWQIPKEEEKWAASSSV